MGYRYLRELLFLLPPELAHQVTLGGLNWLHHFGLSQYFIAKCETNPVEIMGITFPNRVGLAAGLDKNGDYIDALASLGFGHLELGAVTPNPQPGNPQPRLFRDIKAEAMINRMGFNNKGVDYLVERLKDRQTDTIIGVNIGKSKDTPLAQAADDYLICMDKLYAHVNYLSINISSPNTPKLRKLQTQEHLDALLTAIMQRRDQLQAKHNKHVPIAIKLSPDLTQKELEPISQLLINHQVDSVIATNTSVDHSGMMDTTIAREAGGMSGRPLLPLANTALEHLFQRLHNQIPIIGVGGILCPHDAIIKRQYGAQLIQLYTGLIYKGPKLIADIANHPDFK